MKESIKNISEISLNKISAENFAELLRCVDLTKTILSTIVGPLNEDKMDEPNIVGLTDLLLMTRTKIMELSKNIEILRERII